MRIRQDSPHALSFDIEDWFHIVDIPAVGDKARWGEFSSIVVPRTRQILDTLREYRTLATFFVLGWVAERYPDVVRMIADEGHEIGSHSFWHRKVFTMDRSEFQEDVKASIDAIQTCSGVQVVGFRAPSFSITPGCEWAFDAIAELGLRYDASLFPAARAHGGYICGLGPHWIRISGNRALRELPMSVMTIGARKFCFSGGGYLRLLPSSVIHFGVRQTERHGRPTVIYLHPRDFAPDCPVVPMPLMRRFKCYVGLGTTDAKLRKLLASYRFTTCGAVLDHFLPDEAYEPEATAYVRAA